jgi:hypothetical protein
MLSLELLDRARCTREQKAPAVATALELLELSEEARHGGILSLEEHIASCRVPFLGKMLNMIIDSVEPEIVRHVGEMSIAMPALTAAETLEALMIVEGVLSIQKVENPHILFLLLSAYLGPDADLLCYPDPLHFNDPAAVLNEVTELPQERGIDLQNNEKDTRDELMAGDEQVTNLNSSGNLGDPLQYMQTEFVLSAMKNMNKNARSAMMKSLTVEKQSEVVQAICGLDNFDAADFMVISMLTLKNMVEVMRTFYKPDGGSLAAAELLRSLPRRTISRIIEEIGKAKPDIAGQLRDSLFLFDDIVLIEDRSMQKVIRKAGTADTTYALLGASDAVTQKFFNNVSVWVAKTIKDDMVHYWYVRIAEIKEARQRIIAIIRHLEECGEVVIAYPDEDVLQE